MDRITAREAAIKWNVSLRRVQDYCKQGKIAGAERFGHNWMIPADAEKPADRRCKSVSEETIPQGRLLRRSPFLDMTDLYCEAGTADRRIEELCYNVETQALFEAAVTYSRGQIDEVHSHARYFLNNHSEFFAVVSGGMLLSLVAMWEGDIHLWNEARRHLLSAPCRDDAERDMLALSIAAIDSSIRDTNDYPKWFTKGCFEQLPRDSLPAARVYYCRYLMIQAQELAMGNIQLDGVKGLSLMKTLPFLIEPMISQMVSDRVILAEIYLRLICGTVYHHGGDTYSAIEHIDRAVKLCLADRLFGPLAEYRGSLGTLLDDRVAAVDPSALKQLKTLHKQLHHGWTKLHNAVLKKTVSAHLSQREREVARLVAFGFSDQQIAARLFISEASVKSLVRSAKNKTGVEKRRELIDYI